MRWLPKLSWGTAATFAAVFIGVWLLASEPQALQVVRNAVYDQYQRLAPRVYQAAPVRVVDFNDESLKRIGQWPWPRTVIAELIRKLQDAGAVAIGFDVVFAEEDRTSPKAMVQTWRSSGAVRDQLLTLPDHDQVMVDALSRGGVVLGFAGERNDLKTRLPTRSSRIISRGEPALSYLHPFTGAVTSLELLEKAAAGVGVLSFIPDADGVVRRVPLLVNVAGQVMPSLTSEVLRVGLQQRNYTVTTAAVSLGQADIHRGVSELRVGNIMVPTTAKGEMWVHYTATRDPAVYAAVKQQRYIEAWQVLEGKLAPGSLDGFVVLVGTSAQGLMDLRFSPMGTIMPGVEAHAQALEQILTGSYLERPYWAVLAEALVLIFGGILIGFVALTTRALICAVFTAALLLSAGLAAWVAFTKYGMLLDPVTPGITVLITFIVGSVVKHMNSEREQRWVREAFSRYVSPNRVDYLVENPGQLELGGKRQECSFVFTDLENFTGLMEKMDPGAAVALLNEYLDRMVAIAFEAGGTLDRIVGDAVAIMFSAPVPQPDHRSRALKCALDMHAFASKYSADLNAQGKAFGKTRIGVHTGEVIVGNFGGSTMFDYRALGDPVNTAARLEGANKYLGTTVCVSEATLAGCVGAQVRAIGQLVVKGKTQALKVFEPVATSEVPSTGPDAAYDAAYAMLQAGSVQALPAFEALALERPHDTLVAMQLERLRAGETNDLIKLDAK